MRETKMVIIMRKDLGMRKGKMIAQGSHAVLGVALKYKWRFCFSWLFKSSHVFAWLRQSFTKICVSVDSKDELLNKLHMVEYINENENKNIPYIIIQDLGHTEFHGVPTFTCMAIGPYWSDELDKITGDLKLL
jgi:peptidyl-tRNA hydrolase, PTH2 family